VLEDDPLTSALSVYWPETIQTEFAR